MQQSNRQWLLPLIFTVAVFSAAIAFFGALYIFDNKYTKETPKPENGVLEITE
jgi:hypothetical protein